MPDAETCVFAVFPHAGFRQLRTTYENYAEDLSIELDTSVQLVTSRSMTGFATKLQQKEYDIALVGKGQFLTYGESAGYVPVSKNNNRLDFNLIVRSDSEIYNYEDFKSKRLGLMMDFTTTWFITQRLLQQHDLTLNDLTIKRYGSQQACAHALASDVVDGCVMVLSILNVLKQDNLPLNVRVIPPALSTSSALYAVNSSLPSEQQEIIKDYLLSRTNAVPVTQNELEHFRSTIMGPVN